MSLERIAPLEGSPEETSPAPTAPAKLHHRLPGLVAAAKDLTGKDRTALAGEINEVLIAMRAPGEEAEEAKAIVAQLDAGGLAQLADEKGRNCRREAVATLLSMGSPWAFSVSPEELSFFRSFKATFTGGTGTVGEWVTRARDTSRVATWLVVAGHLLAMTTALGGPFAGDSGGALAGLVVALLSALCAGGLYRSATGPEGKIDLKQQALPVTGLVLLAVAGLVVALASFPGAAFGAAVNLIAAFIAVGWQYVPDQRR